MGSNMASPTPPQVNNIKLTAGPGYHQLYSNNVTVRATNWDFLLDFGKILSVSAEGMAVENELGVFLSPQQAKALAGVLANTLSDYEKQFGEIATQPKAK
jgi:hypothetical protein